MAIASPSEAIEIGSLHIGHNGQTVSPELDAGRDATITWPAPGGADSPEGSSAPVVAVVSACVIAKGAARGGSPEGSPAPVVIVVVAASCPEGPEVVSSVAGGQVDRIMQKTSGVTAFEFETSIM